MPSGIGEEDGVVAGAVLVVLGGRVEDADAQGDELAVGAVDGGAGRGAEGEVVEARR